MKKKRKGNQKRPDNIRCPYCGSRAILRSANGIYKENSKDVQLYVCANYPKCDAYVRVHQGTVIPVGSLADQKLRALRKTAHDHFNKLYLTGIMSKDEAYAWLAGILQSPRSQAHIGYLSEYYCQQVIDESQRLLSVKKNKNSAYVFYKRGERFYDCCLSRTG